jgi:TolB protein
MRVFQLLIGIFGLSLLLSAAVLNLHPNTDITLAWLMFEARVDGNRALYRAFPDGSVVQRLTDLSNTAVISLSPDGRWLIYYTFAYQQGEYNLHRMRINGRDHHQLTDGRSVDAYQNWSPDGEWVAYMAFEAGQGSIYKMHSDGSQRQQLTMGGDASSPTWSPDGEWIAYISAQNRSLGIYRMRPDGTAQQRIIALDSVDLTMSDTDSRLFWSPDGEWIAFLALHYRGSNKNIFRVGVERGELEQLTRYAGSGINQQDQFPSWSPDGDWLAFASEVHDDTNITVMAADGSQRVQITNVAGYNAQPMWSPDGQWIVFMSYRGDDTSILRMRRDGSDIQEITNLVTVGGWMAWSPIQERDVTFTGLIFAGMMCIVSIGLRRR